MFQEFKLASNRLPEGCLGFILLILAYLSIIFYGKLGLLFIVLLFPGGWLLLVIIGYLNEWKEDRAKCIHGIRSGKTRLLCDQCKKESEAALAALKVKKAEEKKQQRLKYEANEFRQRELRRLTLERIKDRNNLYDLTPQEFEEIVGEMYKNLGYSVKLTPISNDRGKDIIIHKDGKKYIVECKKYSLDKNIGRPALQKFFAAISEEKAGLGYFITTSSFAKTAIKYAEGNNIELIDGNNLVQMMKRAFPTSTNPDIYHALCRTCGAEVSFNLKAEHLRKLKCRNNHIVDFDININELSPYLISGAVMCEKCGKKMRIVKGRYGKFYGCTGYPQCKNTQRYSSSL